jgi:hypothetical protein
MTTLADACGSCGGWHTEVCALPDDRGAFSTDGRILFVDRHAVGLACPAPYAAAALGLLETARLNRDATHVDPLCDLRTLGGADVVTCPEWARLHMGVSCRYLQMAREYTCSDIVHYAQTALAPVYLRSEDGSREAVIAPVWL